MNNFCVAWDGHNTFAVGTLEEFINVNHHATLRRALPVYAVIKTNLSHQQAMDFANSMAQTEAIPARAHLPSENQRGEA